MILILFFSDSSSSPLSSFKQNWMVFFFVLCSAHKIEVDKYYRASVLLNDSSNLAYALDLKGLDAYMRDKIDSAKMFADQSIRLFRILNDSVGLSTAIYNLSNYHEYLGEYTTALRYLHLAREIETNIFSRLSKIDNSNRFENSIGHKEAYGF